MKNDTVPAFSVALRRCHLERSRKAKSKDLYSSCLLFINKKESPQKYKDSSFRSATFRMTHRPPLVKGGSFEEGGGIVSIIIKILNVRGANISHLP